MVRIVIWNTKTLIKEKHTNIKCPTEMQSKIRQANSEEAILANFEFGYKL